MKILKAKKVIFALLMVMLIISSEGCMATNSNSASTVESKINSDSASIAESRIESNSASTTESIIDSDSASTVENRIKTALTEKTTDLFVIGSEFVFEPGAKATTDKIIGDRKFKETKSTVQAQNDLKAKSSGLIIRIDEGQISMEDFNKYECTLEPLPNNEGVSLNITSTQKNDENTISGIIKGNTLTASQTIDFFAYASHIERGLGNACSGKYSVNMLELEKSKWPPLPVTLSASTSDNNNRILKWEDKNPAGIVKNYDIYRQINLKEDKATKVATVSNCTTWTDTSSAVKSRYGLVFVSYYIVSSNVAGIQSPESNEVYSSNNL